MKTLMHPWTALRGWMTARRRSLVRRVDNHIMGLIRAALDVPSQEISKAVDRAMVQHGEALEEINLFNESLVREIVRMQAQMEHVQFTLAEIAPTSEQDLPLVLSVFKDSDAA